MSLTVMPDRVLAFLPIDPFLLALLVARRRIMCFLVRCVSYRRQDIKRVVQPIFELVGILASRLVVTCYTLCYLLCNFVELGMKVPVMFFVLGTLRQILV